MEKDSLPPPPVPPENQGSLSEEVRILKAALGVSRRVEPAEIATSIVREVCRLSGAPGGFLYLQSPEGSEYHLLGCHVDSDDPRRKGLLKMPLEQVLSEVGFQNISPEVGPCPPAFRVFGFEGMTSVPSVEAGCRSRLLIGSTGPDGVESARQRIGIATRFFNECVPALVNGLRMERVRELVIKDDQTESYNRRYLDSFLAEEVERARRYGTALSLIFLDLDDLKAVNSLHGHAAGSRALREFATRVISLTRGSDKTFRYGGDEFCVVLPETDAVGAVELAERLRQSIASRTFEVQPRTEVSLTASFGIASFPLHAESAAGLLNRADQAMARVKREGKNSIGVGGGQEADATPG